MFIKTLIATALVVPALALSSMAFADPVYRGGPKSGIWTSARTFESNKPYAQNVPAARTTTGKHIYQGGPKTVVPHTQR